MNRLLFVALASASVLVLSGCATNDPLAETLNTANANYVSGDGALTEIAPENRGDAVSFLQPTDRNTTVDATALRGSVVVVNFWYSSCPPCRLEAPELSRLANAYAAKGVQFVGVNVYDGVAAANAFEDTFNIPYPSVLDVDSGAMRLAFGGQIPPNAVPTTLIMDRSGRVAARISGAITDRSVVESMLDRVLAEDGS